MAWHWGLVGSLCVKIERRGGGWAYGSDLPAEGGADQHPAHVSLVVGGVDILGEDITTGGHGGIVWPFGDGGDFRHG